MKPVDLVLVGLLATCFVGVAVLGAAEVAIVRLRRSSVLVEARSRSKRAVRLLRLLDDLPVVLNAVLFLALGLQVSAATIAGVLAGRWFGGIGVTVTSVVLTAALFVYAEAVPKTRAMQAPMATALRLTPLLQVVVVTLRPLVTLLVWLAGLQTSGQASAAGALTEEEIRALARESAAAGSIGEGDAELVARSFEFNDRQVADVMVGRDDISAVADSVTAGDALSFAVAVGHRRLPVHGEDVNDIVGVVRLRDLAAAVAAGSDPVVSSLADDVLRCGPGDPISTLLTRMQRSGRWMAVVCDDHRRTLGLVTIEDVVAELVGEIEDERAPVEPGPGGWSGGGDEEFGSTIRRLSDHDGRDPRMMGQRRRHRAKQEKADEAETSGPDDHEVGR